MPTLNDVVKNRGAVDYIDGRVLSQSPDGGTTAADTLVGTTVRMAITAAGASSHAWLAAAWVGTPTTAGLARTTSVVTLSTANYPNASYAVYAEVTRGSEVEIIALYRLVIQEPGAGA